MIKFKESMKQSNQQRYSAVDIFSTEGRIGRQSYFVYSIILPIALFLVIASIAGFVSKLGSVATFISYALLAASLIAVPLLVVRLTIQRCHDFNTNSGWSLLAMIPFANLIFALIPGNNGLNSYGEAPKPASTLIQIAAKLLGALFIGVATYMFVQFFGINLKELLNLF
jgi:uncharacterized membrane protein YhaH (DUF805 family)